MQQFTPLPLRARSVLELIDTALKVYKQYFLVLIGWSAGVHFLEVGLSYALPQLNLLTLLLTPIKICVASCCVAGAVRGLNVTFGQCWEFTKPRFWSMAGWFLLSGLIGFVGFILLLIPGAILIGLGAGVAGVAGGAALAAVSAALALVVFFAAMSVGLVFWFVWAHMVPLVVSMEEGRSGQGAMARTYELLRGQWRRMTGLMWVLGMGAFMLMLAVAAASGIGASLGELQKTVTGGGVMSPELEHTLRGFGIAINFVMMFFEPAMMLALVLFYLDVRVRKEALDLEWAAHQSQPPTAPNEAPLANAYGGAPATPSGASPFGDFASVAPPLAPPAPAPESAVPWQNLVEATPPTPTTNAPLPGDVATVLCPQCRSISPATSIFCMACGTRLKADGAV